LPQWQQVDKVEQAGASQLKVLKIDKGSLLLEPYASVWYRDYRGPFLFKSIEGDFIATTRLAVSRRGNASGAPRAPFSLAGIMVRTPREVSPDTWQPGGENYVFLSLGAADAPGRYQLEVKSTINSDSQLRISDGAPSGEL